MALKSAITTVDGIIQSILYDLAVNAAVLYIQTAIPFFNIPFFRAILKWAVGQIAGILYNYLDQFVVFEVISLETTAEKDAYLKAVNSLQLAQQSGDQNVINKAIDEFKSTASALIKLDTTKLVHRKNS